MIRPNLFGEGQAVWAGSESCYPDGGRSHNAVHYSWDETLRYFFVIHRLSLSSRREMACDHYFSPSGQEMSPE